MKKLMSLILSMSLLVTMFAVPTYAVSIYGSAADIIEAVITAATSNVSSPSLSSAIASTKSKITVSGDEVSFNGNVIGYWYSDSSNVLWADSSKSSVVLQETDSGYEALPLTLKTLLTDVNNQLTEVITPTTDDWSKIIGKYDIKLGDVTIPKEHWIDCASESYDNANGLVDLTALTGISGSNYGSTDCLGLMSWVVDEDGSLYISGYYALLSNNGADWGFQYDTMTSTMLSGVGNTLQIFGSSDDSKSTLPKIKAKVAHNYTRNGTYLAPELCVTDSTNANGYVALPAAPFGYTYSQQDNYLMYKVTNPSVRLAGKAISTLKRYGFMYIYTSQFPTPTSSNTQFHQNRMKMYDTYSASKTVVGDSALTRRISKLSSLEAAEPLTINDAGWYTADGTNIDDFIGSQNVGNAGDTADINAIADVEPMSFNVIVPTTLPVYIDAAGVVSTASNATIVNKSNAAVKLQAINIVAVEGSDWTLVESNPSPVRDSKEFTFGTSLTVDTVLAKDEVLPFTYSTKLSPVTDGANSLNLATVQVTVDWAD